MTQRVTVICEAADKDDARAIGTINGELQIGFDRALTTVQDATWTEPATHYLGSHAAMPGALTSAYQADARFRVYIGPNWRDALTAEAPTLYPVPDEE